MATPHKQVLARQNSNAFRRFAAVALLLAAALLVVVHRDPARRPLASYSGTPSGAVHQTLRAQLHSEGLTSTHFVVDSIPAVPRPRAGAAAKRLKIDVRIDIVPNGPEAAILKDASFHFDAPDKEPSWSKPPEKEIGSRSADVSSDGSEPSEGAIASKASAAPLEEDDRFTDTTVNEIEQGEGPEPEARDQGGVFDQLGEIGGIEDLEGVPPFDKWQDPPNNGWRQCIQRPAVYKSPAAQGSQRYLSWLLDGGLGQQAWEVANSIAVARILNVTFIVPDLTYDPFWKDSSSFESVFDVEHFRKTLAPDVRVVLKSELPQELQDKDTWQYVPDLQGGNLPENYTDQILPLYEKHTAIKMGGLQSLPEYLGNRELEKLRCRVRFEALRFSETIRTLGDKILSRLRAKAANGKAVGLHLRFEEDMIAFSGCEYLETEAERKRFAAMRKERGWPEHEQHPRVRRKEGSCPPAPGEVAKWLCALGYGNDTQVYLAAGGLYEEKLSMAPFYRLLPNSYSKSTLLTESEWAAIAGKSNLLSALDNYVLINIDVATASFFGVMRYTVAGFRRWHGHKLTPQYPNWIMNKAENDTWPEYVKHAREWTPVGGPTDRYEVPTPLLGNPVPDCMCQDQDEQ